VIEIRKRRNMKKSRSRKTNIKSFRMTPEVIHIVSHWEKQGIDVTNRINYAIINTYPVVITEADYFKDIALQRQGLKYELEQMDDYCAVELGKLDRMEKRFRELAEERKGMAYLDEATQGQKPLRDATRDR